MPTRADERSPIFGPRTASTTSRPERRAAMKHWRPGSSAHTRRMSGTEETASETQKMRKRFEASSRSIGRWSLPGATSPPSALNFSFSTTGVASSPITSSSCRRGPPMKSYHANLGAGIDGIVLRTHDRPAPGPHQILVHVRAVSLNFRELSILRGYYPLPIKPDVILASDGAGEVVAVGQNVTRAKVGDRIAAAIFPHWIDGPFGLEYSAQLGGSLDGMLTEYALLPEDAAVPIPDHLSFEEAATLPCAAVTAWNALCGSAPLLPGQTVLTLGSGGVSLFA